jgi:transcriptional regulator with XRE-family HTH domain
MTPSDFKKARGALGLTDWQMARALGIPRSHVQRIEGGQYRRLVPPLVARLTEAMIECGYRPRGLGFFDEGAANEKMPAGGAPTRRRDRAGESG